MARSGADLRVLASLLAGGAAERAASPEIVARWAARDMRALAARLKILAGGQPDPGAFRVVADGGA